MKNFIMAICSSALLAGCQSSQYIWTRPDLDQQQFQKDRGECWKAALELPAPPVINRTTINVNQQVNYALQPASQYDTTSASRGSSEFLESYNSKTLDQNRRNEYFRACMESKGYVYSKLPLPPKPSSPTNSINKF